MAKKGFTGSEIYFQDKFNEFDLETRYNQLAPKEGFEQVWRDIKNSDFIESMKMEEGEWGKFPPLPISLAGLASLIPAMRLLKPIKGLYELEKKNPLGTLFKTIAGDKSRRAFLQNMIGNTKRFKAAQLKQLYKDTKEKALSKGFKWEPTGPGSKFYNKLQEILAKHSTKHAKGGRIGFDDGGPSQKEIDKGIAAIEKLKSSLMPESYEELIEIYKKKQKDLNIDIMESAGGLGEMLGEGGRIGMMYGGDPGFAFSYGGSWADWKENHASEMPVMDYINQKLPKARNPFTDTKYQDGGRIGFKKGGKGKGEGGIIEDDEFREFLDDRKNRDKDNFQRDFFEDFKKWKKWKEGNIQEAKDGGRMWQPKSAPQLTTTIPPESGPMPHGLTYLTGDDIVQNIGHKHGRN